MKSTSAKPAAGDLSLGVAQLPQDLSPWGMFLHADTIVKAVMIGLAVASLVTWTVWVAKSIELYGNAGDADFRRRRHHLQQSQHFDGDRSRQLQIWRLVIVSMSNTNKEDAGFRHVSAPTR
jgi:hypothetical protein